MTIFNQKKKDVDSCLNMPSAAYIVTKGTKKCGALLNKAATAYCFLKTNHLIAYWAGAFMIFVSLPMSYEYELIFNLLAVVLIIIAVIGAVDGFRRP